MTDPQVTAHLYVTVCLDTVFPVCYGLILAGSALRTSLLDGIWPVLPAACAVLFDYMENMTHFIALRTRKVPKIKPLLSILKWTFLVVALATPLFLVFAAE
ncbi:MAG: hypothetical protein HKN47_05745 [Pirellulaceae bacterium]|nr:hypothetical protein [Pirellulaceae bacterium]